MNREQLHLLITYIDTRVSGPEGIDIGYIQDQLYATVEEASSSPAPGTTDPSQSQPLPPQPQVTIPGHHPDPGLGLGIDPTHDPAFQHNLKGSWGPEGPREPDEEITLETHQASDSTLPEHPTGKSLKALSAQVKILQLQVSELQRFLEIKLGEDDGR